MAGLLAPEELPQWVPGRIIGKSDDLGWSGVAMRSYAYEGQDVEVPAMRDFMLVAYNVGVTPMERRFDGRWSQATCGPGVVSLLTRSQRSHWHWTEGVDVTHLYLTEEFVCGVAREVTGRAVSDVRLADVLCAEDPVIAAGIGAIAAETSGALGGALYVDALARQIVIHLLRRYADVAVRPADAAPALSDGERRRAVEFIEANLGGPLGLDTIAAELGMGATRFARAFKATVGMAPYAYVTERRLERARRDLETSRDPVKQIAARCGFSDQPHLTRQFRRRYGTPPAAFRKALPQRR